MRSSQSAQQRQEAQLAQLLDALDGVEITFGERRTLEWLAGLGGQHDREPGRVVRQGPRHALRRL
jgi:hypothetical protein